MIISLTPNPAVDQTSWVPRLEPGTVHRVHETHIDPAGKGINASRMAHRLGWPTIAFGFVAGDTGNIVERALQAESVPFHFVRVPGQTRVNHTVVDEAGNATSFYAEGPFIPADARETLESIIEFWMQAGRVLVLAGSLPPGMPSDAYASYVRAARDRGVRVILDTHGDALRDGLAARPDLIKPNVHEAERLLGRRLPDEKAVMEAAEELRARGAGAVVISMGKHGAICTHGGGCWKIVPPPIEARSTVGSGDSMVAGMAVAMARGDAVEEGLRLGTAAGAATAASCGTSLGTAKDVGALVASVRLERLA